MAMLYDPGRFMPHAAADFDEMSWLMGWDHGTWCLHDLRPGGTVYLVDRPRQRIVWHTRVTQAFAVPYEAVNDLGLEVARRWGLLIDTDTLPLSGYCVGWRAEPLERLDRTRSLDALEVETDDLTLDGFQFTDESPPSFLRAWGLTADESHWCTGRPRLGWFG